MKFAVRFVPCATMNYGDLAGSRMGLKEKSSQKRGSITRRTGLG